MINANLLATFLYCQRKVFLENVLKIKKLKRGQSVKMLLVKKLRFLTNTHDERIVRGVTRQMDSNTLEQHYRKEYDDLIKSVIQENRTVIDKAVLLPNYLHTYLMRNMQTEILYRSANIAEFIEKNSLLGEELWNELSPKIKSEYEVSDVELDLRSSIDMLENYGKSVVPVLIRTGRAPDEGVWPGHQIIIATQLILLEKMFGSAITKGSVRYLEPGLCRDVVMNPFMKDRVLDIHEKVKKTLEMTSLPSRVENERKCKRCEHYESCYNDEYMGKLMEDFNRKV